MDKKGSKSRTPTRRTRSPSSAAGAEKSGRARGSDGRFRKREAIPASGQQGDRFVGVALEAVSTGPDAFPSTSGISQVTPQPMNSSSSKPPASHVSYNEVWALIVLCLAVAIYLFTTLKH